MNLGAQRVCAVLLLVSAVCVCADPGPCISPSAYTELKAACDAEDFQGCQNSSAVTGVMVEQCETLARLFCISHVRWGIVDAWYSTTNWYNIFCVNGDSYCTWFGIGCDASTTNVEKIDLRNNGLRMVDPIPDLSSLGRLTHLWLGTPNHYCGITFEIEWKDNNPDCQRSSNQLVALPDTISLNSMLLEIRAEGTHLRRLPDFSGLTKLKGLSLSRNEISSISAQNFTDLMSLEKIDLGFNRLETLPSLPGCTALEELSLKNNLISEVDMSFSSTHNHSLRLLSLERNVLSVFPSGVLGLNLLRKLSLRGNLLSELSNSTCSGLPNITLLDFSANRLKALPESIGNCSNLETLGLRSNVLKSIPRSLSTLPNLKGELSLAYNDLTVLPEWLSGLSGISVLDLRWNRIVQWKANASGIAPVPASVLELSFNMLETIPPVASATLVELRLFSNRLSVLPDGVFDAAPLVQLVDLCDNSLADFPRSLMRLSQLKALCLSHNSLSELPEDFGDSNPVLCELLLRSNRLQSVPKSLAAHGMLVNLDLSDNQLTSLPDEFGYVAANKSSACEANGRITMIFPSSPTTLTCQYGSFDVSDNYLTALPPFFARDAETCFLLGGNSLTAVPKWTGAIRFFWADRNKISSISADFCLGFKQESSLDLSYNKLTSFPCTSIMRKFAYVDLSHNQLQSLDFGDDGKETCRLSTLRLNDNLLTDVPNIYSCDESLVVFEIAGNLLRKVPMVLFGNQFAFLDSDLFPNLKVIDLSRNNISVLPLHTQDRGDWGYLEPDNSLFARRNVGSSALQLDFSENPMIGGCVSFGRGLSELRVSGTMVNHVVYSSELLSLDISSTPAMRAYPDVNFLEPTASRCGGAGSNPPCDFWLQEFRAEDCAIERPLDNFLCHVSSLHKFERMEHLDVSRSSGLSGGFPDCLSSLPISSLSARHMSDAFYDPSARSTRSMELQGVRNELALQVSAAPASFQQQKNTTTNATESEDVSSLYCDLKRARGFGLNPELLRYSSNYVGNVTGLFACPEVVLADNPLQIVDVDSAYYRYEACCCQQKYYGNPSRGVPCVECAGEAELCPVMGLVHPLPAPGFWADATPPFRGVRCRPTGVGGKTACANTNEKSSVADWYMSMVNRSDARTDSVQMWCDEGYEGTLCSHCAEDYYQLGYRCRKCPPYPAWFIGTLNVLLLIGFFSVIYSVQFFSTKGWAAELRAERKRKGGSWMKRGFAGVEGGLRARNSSAKGSSDKKEGKDLRRVAGRILTRSSNSSHHGQIKRPVLGLSTIVLHFQMLNLVTRIGGSLYETDVASGELEFVNFQLGSPECYFRGFDFLDSFILAAVTPIWHTVAVLALMAVLFPFHVRVHALLFFLKRIAHLIVRAFSEIRQRTMSQASSDGIPDSPAHPSPLVPVLEEALCLVYDVGFGILRTAYLFSARHVYILLTLFFNSYLIISAKVFVALRCQRYDHDVSPFSFLVGAPYQLCDFGDGRYIAALTLAIVYLVFWVLLLPSVFFGLIFFRLRIGRFLMDPYRDHPRGHAGPFLDAALKVARLFYVYKFLSEERARSLSESITHFDTIVCRFWELWKMFLRVAIAMIVSLLDYDSAFVPFLLICLFGFSVIIQYGFQPFISRFDSQRRGKERGSKTYANELELSSLVITLFNLTAALVSKVPSMEGTTAIGVLVIVINVFFFLGAALIMLRSPAFTFGFRFVTSSCRTVLSLVMRRRKRVSSVKEVVLESEDGSEVSADVLSDDSIDDGNGDGGKERELEPLDGYVSASSEAVEPLDGSDAASSEAVEPLLVNP